MAVSLYYNYINMGKTNFKSDFVFDKRLSSSAKCLNDGKSIEDSIWKCGPPQAYGAYDKYNWCSRCHTIHAKSIRHCPECGCMLRTTSKAKFGGNR